MKIDEMTKEELLAAREIHEKTGATLKVAKIDELLDKMKWENVDEALNFAKALGMPPADSEIHMEFSDPIALAYKMKTEGDFTWKEIGDRVGLKAQGLYAKVKKYARENELPYE